MGGCRGLTFLTTYHDYLSIPNLMRIPLRCCMIALENHLKQKIIEKAERLVAQTLSKSLVYGIDLLYSFPSRASLYISATYGFLAGVSAPSSTILAYTLTTYARAPMNATTTPMLNIQWFGTAKISSTNQKCHSSLTPIVNIVARYPMMVIFRPVFIELPGPLRIGTLLSYTATKPNLVGVLRSGCIATSEQA